MQVEARLSSTYLPVRFSATDKWHVVDQAGEVHNFDGLKMKVTNIFGKRTAGWVTKGSVRCTDPAHTPLFVALCNGDTSDETIKSMQALVSATSTMASSVIVGDPWLSQLPSPLVDAQKPSKSSKAKVKIMKPEPDMLPKWYWELTKPKKNCAPGTIDLTVRNQISPILLRLSWRGWPLVRSREHGWCFRVPRDVAFESRTAALDFTHTDDEVLRNQAVKDDEDNESGEYVFYKLPHKDGEAANVGSPLGKTFMKFAQDGSLTSPATKLGMHSI
jgi:DNA polymerase gamma 1